jgi:hypothetical protein
VQNEALAVEGGRTLDLIDALEEEFSARRYRSKSCNYQLLLLLGLAAYGPYISAIVLFDLEDNSSCKVEIATGGGAAIGGRFDIDSGTEGPLMDKIRNFIEGYASRNGLKMQKMDSQLKTLGADLMYGPTRKSFLKECVKCGKRIPIASEDCKFCGAHQQD